MCDSHASCDELFDCSHPSLNYLQKTCIAGGAVGSRLTGAGWGGCAISLVRNENISNFFTTVASDYYASIVNLPSNQTEYLFATQPAVGARSITLN